MPRANRKFLPGHVWRDFGSEGAPPRPNNGSLWEKNLEMPGDSVVRPALRPAIGVCWLLALSAMVLLAIIIGLLAFTLRSTSGAAVP